jgi:surface antigen
MIGLALGGCTVVLPWQDRSPAVAAEPITTGSIAPRPRPPEMQPGQQSPFSVVLDEEDWRRQRAALATAVDPQGNGGQVRWENPESGHRGLFGSVGNAFLIGDTVCRAFLASVTAGEPEQWFQGTACRMAANEWTIREIKPWKRPS